MLKFLSLNGLVFPLIIESPITVLASPYQDKAGLARIAGRGVSVFLFVPDTSDPQ